MKKLIFKNFIKSTASSFLLILLSLSVIVWVMQAVNYLDFVSEDGHGFKVYFLFTLFNFPKIISGLFVFCFFISAFLTIVNFESRNELSIFWNFGISKIDFIKNLIKFSLFISFILILLTSIINPLSLSTARSFIKSSNIDFFPSLIKEKKFIDTVSNLTIYIDEQSSDKRIFKNILIKDESNIGEKNQIITAKKGYIVNNKESTYLALEDGEIFSVSSENNFSNLKFESFEFNMSKFSSKSTIIPKIQEANTFSLIKCFLNINYNKNYLINRSDIKCTKDSPTPIVEEILQRFIIPIYIPILCLISCFLIILNRDMKYYNLFRSSIFIIGFMIIFFSELIIKYSLNNIFHNLIFIAIPIIIYFLIYHNLRVMINKLS